MSNLSEQRRTAASSPPWQRRGPGRFDQNRSMRWLTEPPQLLLCQEGESRTLNSFLAITICMCLFFAGCSPVQNVKAAADTLPDRYSDAEFWRMVTDFSEPGGSFPYENFVSNEMRYQSVIPEVKRQIRPGDVYLGVAPEQNFSYIAAIQPKVAFIFDIRRQNLVELLMYKALFEISRDRAEFVSRLFSRKCSAAVGPSTPVAALFQTCAASKPD